MTTRFTAAAVIAVCGLTVSCATEAGREEWWKSVEKAVGISEETPSGSQAGLASQEIVEGLKQALSVGVQRAIDNLGRDGGFLDDAAVKILLPSSLGTVEKALRTIGRDDLAEEFVVTMNRAAEAAVSKTTGIFVDTIKTMSLEDAKGILQGPDDAATRYFREHSEVRLNEAVLPIVKDATAKAGVTAAYKRLTGGVALLGQFADSDTLDIDGYVTRKALDGLFLKLAEEEKRIREDPLARSTELLKKVFGAAVR
jgi:hypothetical protein